MSFEPGAAGEHWHRLHPLSPLLRGGFVLIVLGGVLVAGLRDRLIDLFLAEEFVGAFGPDENDLIDYLVEQRLVIVAIAVVIGVIAVIVVSGWVSWRFNTYRITAEAVEERSGVLFRQHRRAPLDRVQSVDLQRPLLARAVGLTQVTVQTAGQGGRIVLRYLAHRAAKQVRERILRDVAVVRAPGGAAEPVAAVGERTAEAPGRSEPQGVRAVALEHRARDFLDADIAAEAGASDALVTVPLGRLIGSILLSWEVLLPLAIGGAASVLGSLSSPFFLLLVIPLGLAMAGVGFGQFNRGFRFTLSRGADGVRVGAGLTATITETIPLGRIHALEARQPLGWRPFGWWKVRVTTAGHAVSQGGQNRLQNTVLPVGRLEDVLLVFAAVLPEAPASGGERMQPSAALREALVGGGEGFAGAGPRAGWVLWFGRRRAGVRIAGLESLGTGASATGATVQLRRGALTRSLGVMPIVRAQSVQLRRPPVHRLLGLASVQVHLVLGPVVMQMRGLELARAREVFDALAEVVVRTQTDESLNRLDGRESRAESPADAASDCGDSPAKGVAP